MKKIGHKIFATMLAFVVLFSTLSFTIDMHFCGGSLVDTAIFQKAKTCQMSMQTTSKNTECSAVKKNCCNDEQLVVDGQDELHQNSHHISFGQQLFVTAFVYTYSSLFETINKEETNYQDYRSPLVVQELYKLDETYLI
ncbi:hypothetical protein ES676_07165 [Bizionia saleffrena]|uniref:Secreted protein n=1 Tax=Bizionia saleffrena TaxID=291189 RepID=A0A8H2QJE4_9FLAO|nr:hypothetical protein [Bizionia saleffrena]TYB74449.1 hypothetical protein ES676_07165 [Bizionia saleffrena]